MNKFVPGGVVVHKYGQRMTIDMVGKDRVQCIWFDPEGRLRNESFWMADFE